LLKKKKKEKLLKPLYDQGLENRKWKLQNLLDIKEVTKEEYGILLEESIKEKDLRI
jgi:hypothetical protein